MQEELEKEIKQSIIALHPTIFVIFGITGDLANRKLLPALISLYSKKMLPKRFTVYGVARRPFTREEFREYIRSKLHIYPGQYREEDIKHFLDNVKYVQGYFDNDETYKDLKSKITENDNLWGQCSNKLFHLSVPPNLYHGILLRLHNLKLTQGCDDKSGWTRVLIEKPFGSDMKEAQELDLLLGKLFKEEQIFRIDHYLAKEAVQNILAFRFLNTIFEPIWNDKYIDKIHVKLFEKHAIEMRGNFYDKIGALKDVGQNHMLQMLALITMNEPRTLKSQNIRNERAKLLSQISVPTPRLFRETVTKGQYKGYRDEEGVNPHSKTETYFRIMARIQNKRWSKTDIFLENGKAFYESKTEIDVYFRNKDSIERENIITFRIQPDEGIRIKFFVKIPGIDIDITPKTLKFRYLDSEDLEHTPNDYERLIHDAFVGDQTLFASTKEIMASWKFVTSVLKSWEKQPILEYEKGIKTIM